MFSYSGSFLKLAQTIVFLVFDFGIPTFMETIDVEFRLWVVIKYPTPEMIKLNLLYTQQQHD